MRRAASVLVLCALVAWSVGCGDSEQSGAAKSGPRYDADGFALRGKGKSTRRPNLIVLVFRGLRGPYRGPFSGAWDGVEPVNYLRAFAPSDRSIASMASLMTGQMPRDHGATDLARAPALPDATVTYAEVLKNTYGYATAIFTQAPWGRVPRFVQGFETRYAGATPHSAFAQFLAAQSDAQPYCAVVHVSDAVAPVLVLSQDAVDDQVLQAYGRGVGHLEAVQDSLRTALGVRGVLDNTLLVVTSDQGIALGERGVVGLDKGLHAASVHVPLWILGKGFRGVMPSEVRSAASVLDVFETFFDWAELPSLEGVAAQSLRANSPGVALVRTARSQTVTADSEGHQTRWYAARDSTLSFVATYDVAKGLVVEHLHRRNAQTTVETALAVDGVAPADSLGDFFCEAVERTRDALWRDVEADVEADGASVTSKRPPSCAKK